MSRSARRQWSPRSSLPRPPRSMKSCAWRSTRRACTFSTPRAKRRSSVAPRNVLRVARRRLVSGEEIAMQKKMTRRHVLKLSGAGAAAASTGGLAGILASGRAPAYGQAMAVHWLRWADFVPASDVLLKGAITDQCQKDLGIKLTVETINANDIQARVTSSIQSQTGPDIIMGIGNWPQLYSTSLADVGDLADEIGKAGGGYYDICKTVA